MVKTMEELGKQLCNYCPITKHGNSINTNQFNLCYGRRCPEAYENYLEKYKGDAET